MDQKPPRYYLSVYCIFSLFSYDEVLKIDSENAKQDQADSRILISPGQG